MKSKIMSMVLFGTIVVVRSLTGADDAPLRGTEAQVAMSREDSIRTYSIESYHKERDHAFITECLAKDPYNFPDADKVPDLDSEYVTMDSPSTDRQIQKQTFKFKQTILVCCLDAQPVGFVRTLASPQDALHRIGMVAQIAVKEEVRRNGIGTSLLTEALEQLKAMGVSSIHLGTRPDNTAAHALYEKVGFERMATTSRYYAYAMQLSS